MKEKQKKSKLHYRNSIRKSTLALLIGLLLLFSAAFSVTTIVISRNAKDDYKIRTSATAVNNASSAIEASLINYNGLTRLLMVNDRIVTFLKAKELNNDITYEARRGIYEVQNLYNHIDSIYVFRNDGQYVGTNRAEYEIDMRSSERYRISSARGSAVLSINGNGMVIKQTDEKMLTMARSIYDINSQKLIGMLIMNISSAYFQEILDNQREMEMCILDQNGTVLCGNAELGKYYDEDCRNSDEVIFHKTRIMSKRTVLACMKSVDPIVVMGADVRGEDKMSHTNLLALVLPLAAFIISAILCIWFITKYITRPIGELEEAMIRTQSKGWLEKLGAHMPENELGRLADSYNEMIVYLNELFNKLIENEKEVQRAEMRVLQEQIKPHFLYNTLETISYMAIVEKADKTHDTLELLGNFYRNFLSDGSRVIPFSRELKITQDYLSLQKLRYSEVFDDEYEIEKETELCMVPKLILQPLVENAIYHGIRLKGEKGLIRITAKLIEEALEIKVYDTGIGMEQETIDKILADIKNGGKEEAKRGFGLAGTLSRINYFCDSEDPVHIESEPGEYTEFTIHIPVRWKV